MRIGVVGGLDRQARNLVDVARAAGHRLETHTGVLRGAASAASLRALVERSDVVVILTDINSHNAVSVVRRQARHSNRSVRLTRRFGSRQLAALLQGLAPGAVRVLPTASSERSV